MTDPISLVTEATAPRTFNVLEAAKGHAYPQDIVNVYTDSASAYRVNQLERKINDTKDNSVLEALVEEQNQYRAKVAESVLTFRLRGVDPGLIRRISDQGELEFPNPEDIGKRNEWTNFSITAAHIVDVTDFAGNKDDHLFTMEDVFALRDLLLDAEFDKINDLVINLSFSSVLFDLSVNADFSLA